MFGKNKLKIIFSRSVKREDKLFAGIYGCDDVKKLFRMALESDHTCSILLAGPPASAKTLFLQSLMKLKDSYSASQYRYQLEKSWSSICSITMNQIVFIHLDSMLGSILFLFLWSFLPQSIMYAMGEMSIVELDEFE